MEWSSEWRFDAWRVILMWNLKKNDVPCHIHPILQVFNAIHMYSWRNDIFFKSVYFLSVSWVEMCFWVVFGRERYFKLVIWWIAEFQHEIKLRIKSSMLGEQFLCEIRKRFMFPVLVILFCKFSMQYMCLWRYDIFFKSVYFLSVSWVEMRF